jgi:methionyl-tRNA formyltransferase
VIAVWYQGRPELDIRAKLALGTVCFTSVRPDLGVSIGGSHIYTPAEIAAARFGIVNLHFAPLPQYRGRYSAGHAIANGDAYFGVTLHYVDEGIDTGPTIAQRLFPIEPTVDALRARAFAVGLDLWDEWAPRIVAAAEAGHRVRSYAQDESRARYYDRHSLGRLTA